MKLFRISRAWWLVALAAASLVVAGASAGSVAEPNDWSVAPTPNPGYYGNIVHGVTARSLTDAWAVGGKATETSNDTFAMHWDGAAWTTVLTPNPEPECQDGDILWGGQVLTSVSALSATDVWAVGSGCYSDHAIIEHWNGVSWSLVASPRHKGAGGGATAALYDVTAISPTNVWAVGYAGSSGIQMLVEHFNGTTWTDSTSGGGASGWLSSVSATGPNDVWAVGAGDSGNVIEHFDGTAWSVVASPQPGSHSGLYSVTAISPTNAWAVGSKTGFGAQSSTFTVHWDGTSWSEVPSPNPRNTGDARNDLNSVAALGPNDVWAVGTYENEQTDIHQDRTLTLHWDGSSWSIVASPTPGETGQLTAIAAAPRTPVVSAGARAARLFVGGFYSNYEKNIYDGHYTLPRTLVLRG